jgi:hypothetical protein
LKVAYNSIDTLEKERNSQKEEFEKLQKDQDLSVK